MKHAELTVQTRELFGHKARKLRRDGILPAVVYSKKHSPEHIQVSQREFYSIFKQAGRTNVLDLINGETKKTPVIVQDIDVDPVTGHARHIDFLAVNLKEKVTTVVPFEFVGVSAGVKDLGAVMAINLDEVEVEALPDNIPNAIEIDISILKEIGDSISIADLLKNDKYEVLAEPEQVIVSLAEGATGIEEETTAPEQVLPEGAEAPAPTDDKSADESK